MMNRKRFWTVEEAMEYTGLSSDEVYGMMTGGEIGNCYWFKEDWGLVSVIEQVDDSLDAEDFVASPFIGFLQRILLCVINAADYLYGRLVVLDECRA